MASAWRNIIKDLEFYLIEISILSKARKYRIGFVMNEFLAPYSKVMASSRIRVYDVIRMFWHDKDFVAELYTPFRKYSIVIFQKKFDKRAFGIAKKLKERNTKVLLDINVNYYDVSSKYIQKKQSEDVIRFTELADGVIATTTFLKESIKTIFPKKRVWVIEESIEDKFFEEKKEKFIKPLKLIWCGYSVKARELLLIADVLISLYKKINFELILICDKAPKVKIGDVPIIFIKYNHSEIPALLSKGDIFITPRELNDSYNLAHSFTKIGVGMAVGLPVIASPVPSYKNSPAILCADKEEWKENLERMLTDIPSLEYLSQKGREYTKENYSSQVIKTKYKRLFTALLESNDEYFNFI